MVYKRTHLVKTKVNYNVTTCTMCPEKKSICHANC